jgi:hypothetical protein
MIILIIILILIILILLFYNEIKYFNDISNSKYNIVSPDLYKKSENSKKILILSTDNRDLNYIKLHKQSWEKYANKHTYTYLFEQPCTNLPIYFCKYQRILELMKTTNFDYYVWVDSDTIVNKKFIDFTLESMISQVGEETDVITSYMPNLDKKGGTLIGSFYVFKNNESTKKLLQDCLDKIDYSKWKNGKCSNCLYGGNYYDEAALFYCIQENKQIIHKVIDGKFISNKKLCDSSYFIIHCMDKTDAEFCFLNNS